MSPRTTPGFSAYQEYYESILGGAACVTRPARCDPSRGIVTNDRVDTVTDEAFPAAARNHHGMRVLVALERRVAARRDLEIAELARERRIVEQDLSRDVAIRRVAVALVRENVDTVPAHRVGVRTGIRRKVKRLARRLRGGDGERAPHARDASAVH